MCGSHNQFDSRVHIDTHIISVIDFLTSILASIVVFSTLGHTSHLLNVPIDQLHKGKIIKFNCHV